MKTITFTIYGNPKKKNGNPMPYTRTTQGSKFSKKALEYSAWKGHVVASYLDHIDGMKKIDRADFGDAHDLIQRKPIKATKNKMHMSIHSTFVDDTHGDSDNVFKGIADALFQNDKYLEGSFTFERGDVGKVEVTISL